MASPFEEPLDDIEQFVDQMKHKDIEVAQLKKDLVERDEKIASLEERANQRHQQFINLAKECNALHEKVRCYEFLDKSGIATHLEKTVAQTSFVRVQCEKSSLMPYLDQLFEYKKLVNGLREQLTTEKDKFDPFLYLTKMENKIDDYILAKQKCEQDVVTIREECTAEIAKIRAECDAELLKQKTTIDKFRSILRRCSTDLSERSKTPSEDKPEASDDLCGLAHSSFS